MVIVVICDCSPNEDHLAGVHQIQTGSGHVKSQQTATSQQTHHHHHTTRAQKEGNCAKKYQ